MADTQIVLVQQVMYLKTAVKVGLTSFFLFFFLFKFETLLQMLLKYYYTSEAEPRRWWLLGEDEGKYSNPREDEDKKLIRLLV